MTTKGEFLYEGKAKRIYATDDQGLVWMEFKDDATAGNGQKRGTITDKGELNANITTRIFRHLEAHGVETHLVDVLSQRDLLVRRLEMIPVEVVVRNRAAGSIVKRLGFEEGLRFEEPLVEFYFKNDDLGDPIINRRHMRALGAATDKEADLLEEAALKIDSVLVPYFSERGIDLIDFKLEFGRGPKGVILADEITPDTCRLWDQKTGQKLDKDRFRQDLGGVEEAYREVFGRVSQDRG